jgi:hypothetical protein
MEIIMTDSIRDAIVDLHNNDANSFKDKITAELMDRAMAAIDLKKIEVGQAMFKTPEDVPVEDDQNTEVAQDEEV